MNNKKESQRIIEIYHQESYANCDSCKNKISCTNHNYHNEIAKNCKRNPNLKDNYIMNDKVFNDFKNESYLHGKRKL